MSIELSVGAMLGDVFPYTLRRTRQQQNKKQRRTLDISEDSDLSSNDASSLDQAYI